MLRLSLESVPYTELDFPKFNPEGFHRIQQAVEVAQQQKLLAQVPLLTPSCIGHMTNLAIYFRSDS
jgi:hypothetical protein